MECLKWKKKIELGNKKILVNLMDNLKKKIQGKYWSILHQKNVDKIMKKSDFWGTKTSLEMFSVQ